jgi:hypothetical protein
MSQTATIKTMSFSGRGSFTVKADAVTCSSPMEIKQKSPGHVDFHGCGNGSILSNKFNLSGNFISNNFTGGILSIMNVGRNGTSVSTEGDTTVVQMRGNKMEMSKSGDLRINGHRYTPYTAKKDILGGEKVFLPEGFSIVDPDGKSVAHEPAKDTKQERESKEERPLEYKFLGQVPKLESVSASEEVSVSFDKGVFSGKELEFQMSCQSSIHVQDGVTIDRKLKIAASGQSSFHGLIKTANGSLKASGQASISKIHVTESCEARSSGQSDINFSAENRAIVSTDKSGLGSIHVSRVHK